MYEVKISPDLNHCSHRYVPVTITSGSMQNESNSELQDQTLKGFFGDHANMSAVAILFEMSIGTLIRSGPGTPIESVRDYSAKKSKGKVTPCDPFGDNQCLRSWLSQNFINVTKVMKYSRQAMYPPMYMTSKSYIEDIERVLKYLNYTRSCSLKRTPHVSQCQHWDPQILSCYFRFDSQRMVDMLDSDGTFPALFQPTFSVKGLGYTFNSGDRWNLFKHTDAAKVIEREMFDSLEYDTNKSQLVNYTQIRSGSDGKQLSFHLRQSFPDVLKRAKTSFWLSIHNPGDVASKFIEISPGYRYGK